METKIEKLPENLVKVEIVVPAKEAVDYYNNAAKSFRQRANLTQNFKIRTTVT